MKPLTEAIDFIFIVVYIALKLAGCVWVTSDSIVWVATKNVFCYGPGLTHPKTIYVVFVGKRSIGIQLLLKGLMKLHANTNQVTYIVKPLIGKSFTILMSGWC